MIEGSPLYHHTSEDRAFNIMSQNKLRGTVPSEDYLELDDRLRNTKNQSAISFTRDKNFEPGISIGASFDSPSDLNVVFVLDRNKLKTKYKIEPFNYSALDPRIIQDMGYERNPELEERVLSKYIYPLDKYVIDIIYKGNNPEMKSVIDKFLNEEDINPMVNELAPHSNGVQEFINHVKETKGLLKHLGFRRIKDLEDYIYGGTYKDFQELKDDSDKFEKKINEQKEENPLPKAIIKIFRILNDEKKNHKKYNDLEAKLANIMKYVGVDPSLAKYYMKAYMLNYRPEGDYENITKDNFVDPKLQSGQRIRNIDAFHFTKAMMPFKGSNLNAYWTKDWNGVPVYVVNSYGWYPIYIFKEGKWYEVTQRYSSSTGKQMYNADPTSLDTKWQKNLDAEVYLMTQDEMKKLLQKSTHDELMNDKKKRLVGKREDIQKMRQKALSTGGWNEDKVKIKFKIKDVVEDEDKLTIIVDIIDVLKRIGNKSEPTPENYLKGELRGTDKEKVEKSVRSNILSDFKEYVGRRLNNYWDFDPSNSIIDFKFNHLREN
jgi:hypothetical protein